jgi:hypothetical protein
LAKASASGIVGALGRARSISIEVARATRIAVRKVHSVLLELDLAEKLQRRGSQLVSLIGLEE